MGSFGSSQLNFLILNYSEDSSTLYMQKGHKSCETSDHTGSILVPEQIPPQPCLAGHQITNCYYTGSTHSECGLVMGEKISAHSQKH